MAWCPKCKNEYREGITVCADCGVELVEHLEETERAAIIFGEKEQMEDLRKFLEYSGLQEVEIRFEEAENVYELTVKEADRKQAAGLARIFMEKKAEEVAAAGGEDAAKKTAGGFILPYQSSQDKADDSRSSAMVLTGIGLVGLLLMQLGMLGILPFVFENAYMLYGVMCTIFVLFLVMGVISTKSARLFDEKAKSENSLKEVLEKWCEENLKPEDIDTKLQEKESEEGELYFQRCEILKDTLNRQFMNLDQDFLEQFIDTVVYDMVFSGKEIQN